SGALRGLFDSSCKTSVMQFLNLILPFSSPQKGKAKNKKTQCCFSALCFLKSKSTKQNSKITFDYFVFDFLFRILVECFLHLRQRYSSILLQKIFSKQQKNIFQSRF